MDLIGYSWLRDHFGLAALPPRRPAQLKPVTRVEVTPTFLAIPRSVAPDSADPLDHLQFALKHEGVELQILAEAIVQLDPGHLLTALRKTPGGRYLQAIAWLWESWTGHTLQDLPAPTGARMPLFDPARYITGPVQRSARWRVDFNGLGSLDYCATVERTPAIEAALHADLLSQVHAFLDTLPREVRDRTLGWAYLDETRHSFAIERETPDEDRKRAFVQLLKQAHQRIPLSEDYLVDLQSSVVRNPFDRAAGFRTTQNWLGQGGRGARAVSYLPPPPELARELMRSLMELANRRIEVDPLVMASIVSFGFVYLHPFMDGNGRLSRFLFHHSLCRSGRLADGLLLPVSVAMHKHEADYAIALRSYSSPLRERWQVSWLDQDQFEFRFKGPPALYRYWNATEAVEFCLRMASHALEIELRQESAYILRYDHIERAVRTRFELRGSDLALLINSCLEHGSISQRRRDQLAARGVPEAVFALVEQLAAVGDAGEHR